MIIKKRKKEKSTIKELMAFMQLYGISKLELSDILGVEVRAVEFWLEGKRDISVTTTRVIRLFKKYPQLIMEFGYDENISNN